MSLRLCILDSACVSSEKGVACAFGEAEKERLEKIGNPMRRRDSEAGLLALRRALGDMDFCDIERDTGGRPHFKTDIGLDFNISHSGVLCAAAVCGGEVKRVGIDIECVREERRDSLMRIAHRYFDSKEKELARGESVLEFYKIWTAKEAGAKLVGAGLSKVLSGKACTEANIGYLHFLVEYSGERYVLCLCTEGQSQIEFVCDTNVDVKPLIMVNMDRT